jgi:hypothetical protein
MDIVWGGENGDWSTVGDWDPKQLPNSDSDVEIESGAVAVTASIGEVASIALSGQGTTLSFVDVSGGEVAGNLRIAGPAEGAFAGAELRLDVGHADGGSTFEVGGELKNHSILQIGDADLSLAKSTVLTAGSVSNIHGVILLDGCAGMSPKAYATLDVLGHAGFGENGVLEGQVLLSSAALVEFAKGQIDAIAAGATLSLDGAYTFIADASDSSSDSALKGLSDNLGALVLANGAAVAVSGSLSNADAIDIDAGLDQGSSSLTVADVLTNYASIQLGAANNSLTGSTDLNADKIINEAGALLMLYGGATSGEEKVTTQDKLVNDGIVAAMGGQSTIDGTVKGDGVLKVGDGAVLQFVNDVSGQTLRFAGAGEALFAVTSEVDLAAVRGFGAGDSVALYDFSNGSVSSQFSNQTSNSVELTLTQGAISVALHFFGANASAAHIDVGANVQGQVTISYQ